MDPKQKLEPGKPRPGQGAPEHPAPAGPARGHAEHEATGAAPRAAQQQPPPADSEKPFVAHYSFKTAKQGDIVRVEIDADANVLLVDDAGLEAYRNHIPFHYIGGGYHRGTALVGIPEDGAGTSSSTWPAAPEPFTIT